MSSQPTSVIAIDGPAASGKSSVSRKLSAHLGFEHINSGAFYRAITWFLLDQNLVDNTEKKPANLLSILSKTRLNCTKQAGNSVITINDRPLDSELHSDAVNANVSRISAIPAVRDFLLGLLRSYAENHNIIMEGRDIGSVVFPDTPFKFYLDASPEVRSQRRSAQGQADSILNRDKIDSSRKAAPLVVAKDATIIDSSNLTIQGVVSEIVKHLKSKGLKIDS
ncbi:MAG: (d)CMP kinase [Chthoniobacterales bacterium]